MIPFPEAAPSIRPRSSPQPNHVAPKEFVPPPPRYAIDPDTIRLPPMRGVSEYLSDLHRFFTDASNANARDFLRPQSQESKTRIGKLYDENMKLHTALTKKRATVADAELSEARNPAQKFKRRIADDVAAAAADSPRRNKPDAPQRVRLERVTTDSSPRNVELLRSFGAMRDKHAWIWPLSKLRAFAAQPGGIDDKGARLLLHARPVSRWTVLRRGEKRYALDPAFNHEITELSRFARPPQLDTEQAMREYVRFQGQAQNRTFYAINLEGSRDREPLAKETTTGFCTLGPDKAGERSVEFLYVKPEYRGRGIAPQALRKAADLVLDTHPHTHIMTYTPEATNLASRAAARGVGFKLDAKNIEFDSVEPKWLLTRKRDNIFEMNAILTHRDVKRLAGRAADSPAEASPARETISQGATDATSHSDSERSKSSRFSPYRTLSADATTSA